MWVKPLASIATLGSGGSGGREGPTMQIGAALGSTVGRYLEVSARERRVLMVAGIAAGISAVFRTPLGAALLAIEMLYRDDFESEALIPAVLASVDRVLGLDHRVRPERRCSVTSRRSRFARSTSRCSSVLAIVDLGSPRRCSSASLRAAQRIAQEAAGAPSGCGPAIGGLALGIFVVARSSTSSAPFIGRGDRGVGILGGGYGAAQVAITGADWLPAGLDGVEVLVLLAIAKIARDEPHDRLRRQRR